MSKARFLRNVLMPFDDNNVMARLGQKEGGTYADHAASDYCNLLLCQLAYLWLLSQQNCVLPNPVCQAPTMTVQAVTGGWMERGSMFVFYREPPKTRRVRGRHFMMQPPLPGNRNNIFVGNEVRAMEVWFPYGNKLLYSSYVVAHGTHYVRSRIQYWAWIRERIETVGGRPGAEKT